MKMLINDYDSFCKSLIAKLNEMLLTNLHGVCSIKIICTKHFIDRLMDRQATFDDLGHIAQLLGHIVTARICELLYGIHLENSFRLEFQDSELCVGATINPNKTEITLRTVVFDRKYDGKHKKFSIVYNKQL